MCSTLYTTLQSNFVLISNLHCNFHRNFVIICIAIFIVNCTVIVIVISIVNCAVIVIVIFIVNCAVIVIVIFIVIFIANCAVIVIVIFIANCAVIVIVIFIVDRVIVIFIVNCAVIFIVNCAVIVIVKMNHDILLLCSSSACNHNLDLVLAVDSSDAVSKDGWQKIKSFMTGILDAFQVSEEHTHVGILTFSSVPYLETRLSENFKKDDIALLINNMQQLQGKQRRIDKALRMAVAEFFSPKAHGFRDDTSKALVLITGGNPTAGSESLASAVKPLQQNGVSAVAVGIGSGIDEAQLRAIGRKAGNYLKVPNYEDLLSYVYPVVKDVCQGRQCVSAYPIFVFCCIIMIIMMRCLRNVIV